MLISPLNAFPWVLNGLMEAWVSVKRLQAFLSLDNLDLTGYYQQLECADGAADGKSGAVPVFVWGGGTPGVMGDERTVGGERRGVGRRDTQGGGSREK